MGSELAKGNLAMILSGSWYADTIIEAGLTDDQFGFFIMPNEKADMPKTVIFEAGPILLAENSRQKEDALTDADYWMSAPAQQVWVDDMNFRPLTKTPAQKTRSYPESSKKSTRATMSRSTASGKLRHPILLKLPWTNSPALCCNKPPADEVMKNLQTIADQYWSNNN